MMAGHSARRAVFRTTGRRGQTSGGQTSGGRRVMHWCWRAGSREPQSRWTAGAKLRQAASGERHSLLLLSDSTVLSCGDNSWGQLGRRGVRSGEQPEQIQTLGTLHVDLVSCGKGHSLAVCHKGRVFAWGAGSEGQLGIGEFKERNFTPKKINALSGIRIIQVSCGDFHSLALSEGGQVFSWGKNSDGQLGLGKGIASQAKPQCVRSLEGIPLAQVAAGGAHSFALSFSGTSFGWGSNEAGQLALSGNNVRVQSYKPLSVGALKNLGVIYISCGYKHTAVLTQDGQVFTFGDNSFGQLGYNSTAETRGPQLVERIDGLVSQIDCGSYHTLAYVYTTGQVVSFGCGPSCPSNPTQPEAPTENFNITCLISAADLVNVQVKHIFAGTHANFVTVHQDTSSTSAFKKTLPEISQINQSLAEKWIAVNIKSKEHEKAKSEITVIFSSPACLIKSFLKKRETGETIPIDVDLQMASDTFKKLLQKEWISSMIAACLQDSLFRALPCCSPHQEALSVFLLLPECLVIHHARKWRDLAVLFAEAICKMSKQSLRVLRKCWASLEASSLSTLVQMLKTAFICEQHFSASPLERHRKFKALLETMREVHEVNKINSLLPESTFYIKELSCNFDFFAEGQRLALRDKNMVPEETASVIFSDFPFIFNLLSKIKLLQAYSHVKMWYSKDQTILPGDNQSNTLTLRVGRGSLVADALRQLSQVEDTDLSKVLVVEFIKEIRPESGGVTSEFFHCMFEKLTNPEYGMFMYPEEGSYMWFPANPKFEKKSYFLFGLLCGLSLFNFNLANLSFPLVLYKKLLEQKPSLEDLKELSPLLGRNLQELLNYEDGDIEELSIYFSINWDQNEVDLIPDGISKPVNQSNKKDYISKYVDYIFNISVKETYEEFHRGFYKVCNWNIIRLFQPEELMKAIIGNTDYDWKQFENNSVYCGEYHKSHPTILMFWKAFYKLTLDEKKKFLRCDRLPIKGLHNKGIVFRCPEDLSEKDHPRSVTCHNILDLPKYSTMKRMKEALRVIINNYRGFKSPGVTP